MKSQKFSTKIIITYGLIAVIAYMCILVAVFFQLRSQLLATAIDDSFQKGQIFAESVAYFIEGNAKLIESVAIDERVKDLDKAYIVEELCILKELNRDIFLNTVFIDLAGDLIDCDSNTLNIKDRYFYDVMLKTQDDYVLTNVDIGRIKNQPMFSIGVPIRDEKGDNIGAIAATVDVYALMDVMSEFRFQGDSYPWISDPVGTVAIHPNPDYPYHINIDMAESIGYEGFNDIAKEIHNNKSGYDQYNDLNSGEKKLITYSPIPGFEDWSLNITTLTRDIYRDMDMVLTRLVGIYSIMLIVVLFIIHRYGTMLSKPISEFTYQVMGSKEYRPKEVQIQTNIVELTDLESAFNELGTRVNDYIDNLEATVDLRTRELEEKNFALNGALDELNIKAKTDSLTGLYNRNAIYEYMESLNRDLAKKAMTCYSVLFLDLDNFKFYNDYFGHDKGDQILSEISARMKSIIRENDFIGRYGGDEFVVVLPRIPIESIDLIVSKLNSVVSSYGKDLIAAVLEGRSDPNCLEHQALGVSIGIAENRNESVVDVDEIIRLADQSMYREKQEKKKSL